MPLRVLNSDGSGELWRIKNAIIYAANHGANVVNISFGYPDKVDLLKKLIEPCHDGTTDEERY